MVAVTVLKSVEYGSRARQMRRVLAEVNLSTAEAIVASDLWLTSIEAAQVQKTNDTGAGTIAVAGGTILTSRVDAPGSFESNGNALYVGGVGFRVTAGTLDGAIALAGSFIVAVQADGW